MWRALPTVDLDTALLRRFQLADHSKFLFFVNIRQRGAEQIGICLVPATVDRHGHTIGSGSETGRQVDH